MKRSNYIIWTFWALVVLLLLSDCRRRDEDMASVRGIWEVESVSIQDGNVPGDYASLPGERLIMGATTYTLGSKSGTYTFNRQTSQVRLTPGLGSTSPEEFALTFDGNRMRWERNIADPAKSFENRLTIVFVRRR